MLQLVVDIGELFEGVGREVDSYFLQYSKGFGCLGALLQAVEAGGYFFAEELIEGMVN